MDTDACKSSNTWTGLNSHSFTDSSICSIHFFLLQSYENLRQDNKSTNVLNSFTVISKYIIKKEAEKEKDTGEGADSTICLDSQIAR